MTCYDVPLDRVVHREHVTCCNEATTEVLFCYKEIVDIFHNI